MPYIEDIRESHHKALKKRGKSSESGLVKNSY